jgi:hypothetical protein
MASSAEWAEWNFLMQHPRDESPDDHDTPEDPDDEGPTTPTDEPKPVPVQDPPAEPDQAPYVVAGRAAGQSPQEVKP